MNSKSYRSDKKDPKKSITTKRYYLGKKFLD